MSARYAIVSQMEIIKERFRAETTRPENYRPSANVSVGRLAPVVLPGNKLEFFQFGLTPFWSAKPMYLFEARSEGDNNPENDIRFRGSMGILHKPAFRKAIRSNRCLVIADCFFKGSQQEKLSKPYLVYLRNHRRPFAFAGIWDEWKDPQTGELVRGFAIVTTVANDLMKRIGHPRLPVILRPDEESLWLDPHLPLDEVVNLLRPYPAEGMNAYPIDPIIRNPRAEGMNLLRPIGERIYSEAPPRRERQPELVEAGYYRLRKPREE